MTEAKLRANRANALKAGRPRGKLAVSTLSAIEARKWFTEQVTKNIEPLFNVLYNKALQGDIIAIKELFDRSYGKAPQGLYQSDQQGNPIVFMPLELMQKHELETTPQKVIDVNSEDIKKD